MSTLPLQAVLNDLSLLAIQSIIVKQKYRKHMGALVEANGITPLRQLAGEIIHHQPFG